LITSGERDSLFLFQVASGQVLYARSEKERVAFEKKAMFFYYDTQYLRNIFQHHLSQRIREGNYGR